MRNPAGKVVSPIHFDGAMKYLRSMIDRVVVVWLVLLMFPVGVESTWAQGLGERINLSGYGLSQALDHTGLADLEGEDDPNDFFWQVREFSLFFDFDIADGILASLELQATDNATDVQPNFAYVDIDIPTFVPFWDEDVLGGLGLRVGRLLVPFLSYNENKASFRQPMTSQPFTAQNIVPVISNPPDFERVGWSDVGLSFNWFREVGNIGLFDLKFSVISGLGSDTKVLDDNTVTLADGIAPDTAPVVRPRDGLSQNTQFDIRDNNSNKSTVIKFTFVPTGLPIDLGFSWYNGAWDNSGNRNLEMFGVHANWLARNWTFKGEWVQANVEQKAGTNVVADAGETGPPGNTSIGDYTMYAWYALGSYIPLRWGPSDDRYLRLVFRYDRVNTNNSFEFTPWNKWRLTPAMELQFSSNARLRYEFQYQTIRNWSSAPASYKDAGGKKHIKLNLISLVFWF